MATHNTIETLINEPYMAGMARAIRKKTRNRRPLPPQQVRDWMTASETALTLRM
jgi:hypothetical protein